MGNQTVSRNKAGPVQTASAKRAGPVLNPKSLTQLARVSKYKKQSSFQNLFHERLEQMPGKRERAQITINAVTEHTIGNRTEYIDKTYGPFKMEVPKLSKPDMYKFLM